jgi:hypothetical protein
MNAGDVGKLRVFGCRSFIIINLLWVMSSCLMGCYLRLGYFELFVLDGLGFNLKYLNKFYWCFEF